MDEKKLDLVYRISFHGIRMMHDSALMRLLVRPDRILAMLGLKEGDTVLEPGCGPGFFTIGAARVVGAKGYVYSYDVNPYAIRYLQKKLDRRDLQNVTAEVRNAADTNLPEGSVDFAFITGIPRAVGGFDRLMKEVSRTLKPAGLFAYRGHGRGRNEFTENELEAWKLISQAKVKGFEIFQKSENSFV